MKQMIEKSEMQALVQDFKTEVEQRLKHQFIDFSTAILHDMDTKIEEDLFKERMKRKASLMDFTRLKEEVHELRVYCHG